MVTTRTPDDEPPDDSGGAATRELQDGARDVLIREEPLEIAVRDRTVVTMRTPGRDADLAVGFLLTEGVLRSAADVQRVEVTPGDPAALRSDRAEVHVVADTALHARITGKLARTHEIRSSCGICGLVDADEILEGTPPLLSGVPRVRRDQVATYLRRFGERQELFGRTGGCHGAALFDADAPADTASIIGFGEDVGRHNALDKAIGEAACRSDMDLARTVAVLSGRAGFDLVLKCLRMRIPVIVSVSAASALSHDLCASAGATLLGFARGPSFRTYTDGGRLVD